MPDMLVARSLPSPEAAQLVELAHDIATRELAPQAAEAEEQEHFPRETFRKLGAAGLLSLPYPEKHGGAEQPYEVYLQVLEELAHAGGMMDTLAHQREHLITRKHLNFRLTELPAGRRRWCRSDPCG